jgi:hypothetical protein
MTQLLFGALLGSAPILLVVISALVAGYGSISPGNILINDLLNSMLPVLASVLLLSSLEEFTLRGYLFRQLAIVRQDPTLAAIVTGILFGLLHSGNPGANWQGLLFTSIGGILMGFLLIRSANLWLPIGYHFGWNACSGNVFGMSVSGMDVGPSILVTTLSGSNWLTGGSYGFESSIPAVAAEIMVLTSIILVFRRKGHETFSI